MNSTNTHANKPLPTVFPVAYFRYLSPINLILAIYITIQNSMVIYDYSQDWKRLSSCLFILIAAVDIGSACSEVVRGSVTVHCLNDESTTMQSWVFLTYNTLGLLCYTTSTFFGMVLTIVKTINILNPFYRVRGHVLKICLATFPSLGLIISVVDIWFTCNDSHIVYNMLQPAPCPYGSWPALFYIRFVGQRIMYFVISHIINRKALLHDVVGLALLFFEFGLPCLVVFICMVLQIIYVRRAFRKSSGPQQNTANHATMTIFLVSLLNLFTSSYYLFSILLLEEYFTATGGIISIKSYEPLMVARYTLPLLNAALFPTILILRKPELRARYRGYISTVLHHPVTAFYLIRHRRAGYTVI